MALADGLRPRTGFRLTNNIALHGLNGFAASGAGEGSAALAKNFSAPMFEKNVIVGADPSRYPSGNFFPGSPSAVGFVAYREGKYQLASFTRYRHAGTDGKDIGADLPSLDAAVAGAVGGGGGQSSSLARGPL